MSEPTIYPWKRFWLPFGSQTTVSTNSYFPNPDSEQEKYLVRDARTLDQLFDFPCLILRAEPGLGKTFEMTRASNLLEQRGLCIKTLNLRLSGNGGLNHFIFDTSWFKKWKTDDSILHLFLDSLDEGLLTVDNLASYITEELKNLKDLEPTPWERLRLRIACRTAIFPETFKDNLVNLFRKPSQETIQVGDYVLAQLREIDAWTAASLKNIDPDVFLKTAQVANINSFAARPITLNFLLHKFAENGELPNSRRELLELGCRELCIEHNPHRIETQNPRFTGSCSVEQRLKIATRIAAVNIFYKDTGIWRHDSQTGMPAECIQISYLTGDTQSGPNETELREVLSTPLFITTGDYIRNWAHPTFTEFLAACFVESLHNIQLRSLFIAEDGKIYPQLQETAAWLASFRKDFFSYLVTNDPIVLLSSDLFSTDYSARESLVESILYRFNKEELLHDSAFKDFFHQLDHPKLSLQLAPFITDQKQGFFARQVAIRIATECRVSTLQFQLANLALSSLETHTLRVKAVVAIWKIADSETIRLLYPLITKEAGDDPNAELKGWALTALWEKRLISATELFSVLTPGANGLFGGYWGFLNSRLVPYLVEDDLPTALHWIAQLPSHNQTDHEFERLESAILEMAFRHLDNSNVLHQLVETLYQRAIRFEDKWPQFTDNEEGKRLQRHFIKTLLASPSASKENSHFWIVSIANLAKQKNDFYWCAEQFETATREDEQDTWACLVAQSFNQNDHEQFERLVTLSLIHPVLRWRTRWFIDPVELDSESTKYIREDYNQRLKREHKEAERAKLQQEQQNRITELLQKIETGQLTAWHWLVIELKRDGSNKDYTFSPELTLQSGWQDATGEIRNRIQQASLQFLLEEKVPKNEWLLDTKGYPWPCLNGVCALFLLYETAPDSLQQLDSEFWSKWSASLLAYPISPEWENQKESFEIQQILLKKAFEYSPFTVFDSFAVRLRGFQSAERPSEHEHDVKGLFARISTLWDERWDDLCLEIIQNSTTLRRSLLWELLKHCSHKVRRYAETLIPSCENDPRILEDLITFDVPGARNYAISLLEATNNPSDFKLLNAAARGLLRTHIVDPYIRTV